MAGYRQALDTFVMEIDGIPHGVMKGAVLSENDPVVKHDIAHGGRLFAPLDMGEDEKPAKAEPAKAEPKPAPAKPAGRTAAAKGTS